MTRSTVTLVIADDHPIVRTGMASVIQARPELQIVGEAHSFDELWQQLQLQPPNILILDLNGMGMPPLTMVSRIRREFPDCQLIIFSSSIDLAPELLDMDIAGYLAKENLETDLIAAIQAVSNGKKYLAPSVIEYMDRVATIRQERQLTASELQVLGLLAQGYGTIEIAEMMRIDPRSVQNYITRLRRKTGCSERTQLVDWYRRVIIVHL